MILLVRILLSLGTVLLVVFVSAIMIDGHMGYMLPDAFVGPAILAAPMVIGAAWLLIWLSWK